VGVAPALLVVTVYDRPDGLARLVDDLEREGLTGPRVHVYDDASPMPDPALVRRLAGAGCTERRPTTAGAAGGSGGT